MNFHVYILLRPLSNQNFIPVLIEILYFLFLIIKLNIAIGSYIHKIGMKMQIDYTWYMLEGNNTSLGVEIETIEVGLESELSYKLTILLYLIIISL